MKNDASVSDHKITVYMTYVALVFVILHLMYMNLLINARFYLSLSC